ncbi:hypothetical protein NHH03_00545 [Stieleria sp. TO1_6]|uniref:hypothetical protein n=1 Tax=Stieleria tagensis TaxID=2956795 RepID=UPI00209B7115|nr:hypothetical protein [Stieleria tagensis]MCO8120209.1 hypothetical protein [Stieleria tagensis]
MNPIHCVESKGPWPFVTQRVMAGVDGARQIWSSRHHRKGLRVPEESGTLGTGSFQRELVSGWRWLWMPQHLNWWIGFLFAVGALCFAAASSLSLLPSIASQWQINPGAINRLFFIGSIPFTSAAYLQLFQAANAADPPRATPSQSLPKPRRRHVFGWRPGDIGWISCVLQFIGTLLFNVNTFDAMLPSLDWFQSDLLVWVPNLVGSVLFLVSGYLAFIEVCHAHWGWHPRQIGWCVAFINLIGCVGFMISAACALFLPGDSHNELARLALLFTLIGAIGFFGGALLMQIESTQNAGPPNASNH